MYSHRPTLPLLPTAFGSGYWKPVVIGNFQEGDARMFLEKELGSSVAVDDSTWAKVYEVRQASSKPFTAFGLCTLVHHVSCRDQIPVCCNRFVAAMLAR